MRAVSAISSDGRMVVPHVINPTNLPPGFVETTHYTEVKNIPIDPTGWNTITDALGRVLLPEGTAPSAHIPGMDIAGKTGSSQTISNAGKARLGAGGKKFKDNGWFVGVEPRRNPEIVVCTLLEEGEHGYLAARATAQVVKAYVEKQRRQAIKVAGSGNGKVEIGALWNDSGSEDGPSQNGDHLHGGRFLIDVAHKRAPLAVAAPGMH
jgi:penicillin-binding protein 2